MNIKKIILLIQLFGIHPLHAHSDEISGYVYDASNNKPLEGVLVYVKPSGLSTRSNEKGFFDFHYKENDTWIFVSAMGYLQDSIQLTEKKQHTFYLQPIIFKEVEVSAQGSKEKTEVQKFEIVSGQDLLKDACCNLSESFENTTTVDVNYSDAITGAKEIRMLGLDGVYAQITMENIPSIRGLGNTFGMNFIPGPWMSSIQINKGAGSVVNGYESTTGQINIELKKPQSAEKLHVGYFINQDVRNELNLLSAYKINCNWSGLTAIHGQLNWLKMDMNHDGFMDNPLIQNVNILNRFTYISGKLLNFVGAVIYNVENRQSGQMKYNFNSENSDQQNWGMNLFTQRLETFAKTGFVFSNGNSIGIQYKYIYHEQKGFLGKRNYAAKEHFGYFNLIYQHEISEKNILKTGVSYMVHQYSDSFFNMGINRLEMAPGVFGEANINYKDKLMTTLGLRADYNTIFGPYITPRIHVKWNILYDLSIRLSAGRGYRTPLIFAENFNLLSSNRNIQLPQKYQAESAWNFGANATYLFYIDFRAGRFSVDYYFTKFENQLVYDIENPKLLSFYNVRKNSRAHSMQAEVEYELIKNFTLKLAYKFEDARVQYESGTKIVPLKPQHRGLVSMEYQTKKKNWRFNTSLNWFGKTRVPASSHSASQISKDWFQLNAQITYKIKQWEVYIGGENIANFYQPHPIIHNDQPFSDAFDATLIWGPLRGAMAFAGVRFNLK